jgi:type II secretory pathway component GspD/PulD (secretin)
MHEPKPPKEESQESEDPQEPQVKPESKEKTTGHLPKGTPKGTVFQWADYRQSATVTPSAIEMEVKNGEASEAESMPSAVQPPVMVAPKPLSTEENATPAPVYVNIGPNGEIVVSSEDVKALELMEELITQLTPPHKEYEVYRLKYASAYGVALNLQDYFKDDKKEQSGWRPWWMDSGDDDKDDKEQRLSKRKKLKFIPDYESNTILVDGAQPSQLRTIENLIELYDQPQPADSQSVRKTETIHLQNAKAKVVADAVKEVYRDLLSANDKALANPNQPRDNQRGGGMIFSFGDSGRSEKSEHKSPRFKGELSIGIDETSNTLIVSAPKYLFADVSKMIQDLDTMAAPSHSVRVVRIGPGLSASQLQEMLDNLINPSSVSTTQSTKSQNTTQRTNKTRTKSNNNAGGNVQQGHGMQGN